MAVRNTTKPSKFKSQVDEKWHEQQHTLYHAIKTIANKNDNIQTYYLS